jgi:hypothetical protein
MKIPKKYQKYIKEAWQDDDGLWVQLKKPYIFNDMGSTVIAQDTMQELIEQLKDIIEDNQGVWEGR